MDPEKLYSTTTEALVALYAERGIDQYDALDRFDTRTFNRIFRFTRAIEKVLALRSGDERRALQAIRAMKWNPQSLDAGMSLWAWDEGIWKAD